MGLSIVAELLGFVLVYLVGAVPGNGFVGTAPLDLRLVPHALGVACEIHTVALSLVVRSGVLAVAFPCIPIRLGKLGVKSVLQTLLSPRLNLGERLVDLSTQRQGSGLGLT